MRRPLVILSLLAVFPAAVQGQTLTTPTEAAAVATPRAHASALVAGRQAQHAARLAEARTLQLATATTALPAVETDAPTRADGFASSGFAQFMSSPAGRVLRVVAGAGMIAGGIAADSDGGTVLAGLGAVPLLAGTFDFCVLSPLFGGPFWGRDIRAAK